MNAFAIGILMFLIIDVLGNAWTLTEEAASNTLRGKATPLNAAASLLSMFVGLGIGLLGLTWYESKYMRSAGLPRTLGEKENVVTATSIEYHHESLRERQQLQEINAYKLSIMIAIGIGIHNFSEGLDIGQSYVSGQLSLAILLIVGFGAHNTTE
jgi:zinc transporter, ZIP family